MADLHKDTYTLLVCNA